MLLKYKGKNIDIKNTADNPKKSFFAYFDGYTIDVNLDDFGTKIRKQRSNINPKNFWIAQCSDENGGYIVDGIFEGTMRNAVQICLENME